VSATPERPQSIKRIVQNYVFLNMICGRGKQFFDARKDSPLRFFDPLRKLIPVVFEQRSVIKRVPLKARRSAGYSSAHDVIL